MTDCRHWKDSLQAGCWPWRSSGVQTLLC